MISAPPTEGTSNELADWLELEVLASEDGYALLAAINEHLELDEDFEPLEMDDENVTAEKRLQQVASAVDERIRTIGPAYPFFIDSSGTRLTLSAPYCDAACAYLFCLIISNGAKDGLLAGDGPWTPDLHSARSLFQICATVAAAGFVEGPAFSFGWPRLDSTGFLHKLRSVYGLFQEGAVHDTPPPGAPIDVKDDRVDVIAWKGGSMGRPGTMYLLGQAASGANWKDKSLKGYADVFHGTWFLKWPSSPVITGTIIPFLLPTEADGEDHEAQEVVAGKLDRLAREHGVVLFRHRVAKYVARAIELKTEFTIERIDELSLLCAYVTAYQETLRSAIAEM